MECLRFGSSIPGGYWGCCAADVMQNFNTDPDAPASIQLVDGDGGVSFGQFLGMTEKEVFLSRLRIGTFSTNDMPNHAFFVMLSKSQLSQGNGKKWLAILKENGFEFVRTVNNSVWNVDNYVFGLFRNIGTSGRSVAVKDQFTPPAAWTELPSNGKTETYQLIGDGVTTQYSPESLTKQYAEADQKIWDKIGPAKFYSQKDLEDAGVPVLLSAIRTQFPPQGPETRKKALDAAAKGLVPSSHHRYNELDPAKPKAKTPTTPPQMEA
jgi:hypothetical protein